MSLDAHDALVDQSASHHAGLRLHAQRSIERHSCVVISCVIRLAFEPQPARCCEQQRSPACCPGLAAAQSDTCVPPQDFYEKARDMGWSDSKKRAQLTAPEARLLVVTGKVRATCHINFGHRQA